MSSSSSSEKVVVAKREWICGLNNRGLFVFLVGGDGAALANWCYRRLQPKAAIESYMDVAALAAELKKKSFCQA